MFISSTEIDPLPSISKITGKYESIAVTVGLVLSTTVTVAVAVEELDDWSVPVKVTVTGFPISAQLNVVWLIDNESVQLSLDPLSKVIPFKSGVS